MGRTARHARCHWRSWGAEAAGTALMVLAILLAAAVTLGTGSARFLLLGAIVAPSVALIALSPLGRVSGAHINPAVTLGFWALGRLSPADAAGYVSAQLAGGLAGAAAGRAVLPGRAAASIGGAVTHPSVAAGAAVALEACMTAALLAVIFALALSERRARWTPIAIVPLLTAIIWLGSPWTGASLNPARSEGPAIAFGDVGDLWIYLVAPCGGALVVALAWRRLPTSACNASGMAKDHPVTTEEEPMSQTVVPADRAADALPGLKGKNVLVTGGSSGIGQAIAVRFAQYGANVAINYLRTPEEARDTEEQVHACVHRVRQEGVHDVLVGGDVSDEADVVRMVREAAEGLGGLDVLVNNAGIQISRPSDELSSADFDRVLAVNLRGSFLCAREAIRAFLDSGSGGSIVNVSSVHQLIPKPGYLGYSASKGGMQNLTRTLALEYAPRGIRVNGVGPGATVTPINRAWIDDPVKRAQVEEHIPMQRAGDADEMAGVTCFLSSDLAAYITGQTIFVDGGLTLFPSFATPWSSE